MNIQMKSGRITIDGRDFVGSHIIVDGDGSVTIDGVCQSEKLIGDINIIVHGDVDILENTSGRVAAGNVGSLKTVSGDIDCLDVSGNVQTVSGDVSCRNITGSVKSVSGDIK